MSGGIGGGSSPVTAGGAGGQINPSTGASNPGQTPTGQPSRGGGGGGGSAGGGGGGAGQTTMTAGASGNMPITQQGGSGGAGGTDGAILAVSSGSNSANETGGNGTAGQPGTAPRNSSTGAPGQDDIGGGGGEGGYGVILTGSGTSGANAAFSNTGTVTGGKGGNGGFDTSGSANAVSGEGGDGGIAIDVLGTGVALMNTAALRGGNAGAGEVFSFNGSGITTTYGTGGAAIAGANLTINDSGSLTGGLNGDGSQGAAIDFTGGANTLKITGGTVTGGIIDTGSLTLESASQSDATYSGISGSGSVDIASGTGVYLLGVNTYAGGTTVGGSLILGNGTAAGTLAGPVTIESGGTLDLYLPASSSATLAAVSGSGSLDIEPDSSVTIVSDNLTAGGMFSGTYNFGTLTIEGGTDSAIIQNGGTLNLAQTGATSLTISSVISDLNGEGGPVVGTVVAKSGTTILSGANTYTGNTFLESGIIDAENALAFGTGTVHAIDPEIDYGPASGATQRDAQSATQTNGIELDVGTQAANDPTILKVASDFTETISGAITTGSGTNSANQTIDPNQPLVVDGPGTLVLSGANSFSGGTTLNGSGTLELDSASAAGGSTSTSGGADGAVTFAAGSTATLRIDQAALSSGTYADPISNFAFGETVDLAGFTYSADDTTAALNGRGGLEIDSPGEGTGEVLTTFADAAGQSGQFTTADDYNGGTLVTLLPPPPAAPTNLAESGTATLTSDVTITGHGDAAGDTIDLYADGGTTAVGTGTVGSNNTFSVSTTGTFADGGHTFTATETSATTGETSANSGGSTLYSFTGGADGSTPRGSLFADAAGNLIGTTTFGGTRDGGGNNGTVFEIANTSGSASAPAYAATPTTLYTFTGENTDGAEPDSGLVADANGDLFGTTQSSGSSGGMNTTQNNGGGAVFEVVNTGMPGAPAYADGAVTLYPIGTQFTGLNAGLAIDAAGDLFGTTRSGGEDEDGTVFEIANTGTPTAPVYATAPTTLYSFTGGADGAIPQAGLITDAAGDLFGTTVQGGANGYGTVFELANTGTPTAPVYATTPTTLNSFTGQGTDGAYPDTSLIADAAGDLFGTTSSGGTNGGGTAFEIRKNADGTFAQTPITLASFESAPSSLTIDTGGNLYGTIEQSGPYGNGSVFEIAKNSDGTYASTPTTLHSFGDGSDGANPEAGLISIAGGLYGTTAGGTSNGAGTVFETIPAGIAPVVIAAEAPTLTTVSGTASNGGTLEVQGTTPDAAGDTITFYNGSTVVGARTVQAGTGGANTFAFTTGALPDGTYTFTATDTSADGTTTSPASAAMSAVVTAPAPTGLHQIGTATAGNPIEIAGTGDATGDTITLYNGTSATAANEVGTGTVGANGQFDITTTSTFAAGSYTITATDTSADGTVTSAISSPTTSVTLNTLYSFPNNNTAGGVPLAGLIADAAGDLLGTADSGGTGGGGTVFEVANTGSASAPTYANGATTLVNFSDQGTGGANPQASLVADAAGNLFGTTSYGGNRSNDGDGDGTVFEIANTGTTSAPAYATTATTVYSFAGSDGAHPQGGLITDANGDLFGTTSGDLETAGSVFELIHAAGTAGTYTERTLATFTGEGSAAGSSPQAGLVVDGAGNLFGTTTYGGGDGGVGDGTVFEIANSNTSGTGSPSYTGNATTLFSFSGTNGDNPEAGLVADTAGNLYGTTASGGVNNDGTVFEIVNGGTASAPNYAAAPTTLVSFNGTDGANPQASLVLDAAGNLFGTTSGGGVYASDDDGGTIFEVVANGNGTYATTPTVLHSFNGTDGSDPRASLLLAASGTLYGTTAYGGANNGDGTVFALTSQANQPTAVVTAPPVTITAPASGSTTNLIDPTIAGTAAAGSTIALTSGGTSLGSTTVDGNGNWSDAVTFGADGTYTVTATDTANGQAAGSASDTFTINSTPNENLFGAITHDVTSPGGDVYALYQTILGRAPDALGLEADVAALGGGTPLATIAQDQLSSPDYTADYGSSTQSTNDAFVGQLYQDGLHRTASASELTFWDNQLADGLTRAQVGVDIATSQESQNDLAPTFQAGVFVPSATDSSIARLYYGLLDRAPDAAGLQGWEGALANGTSLTQVAQAFLGSAEYQAGTVGQGNAQYVQGLYQSALGRAAEPNGLQAFAGGLDTGTLTRAAVADDILTSNEFQGDQAGQTNSAYVNAVYEAALGRPADQAGLQGWDNALASGTSRASVAQDIVGSAEFQQNVTTPGQAAFVNALYQGALGGNADAGGLQANENALNGGATLASVALGVTQGAQAPGHLAPKIEIGFHIS